MNQIATYSGHKAFWFDCTAFDLAKLPKSYWICLAKSDTKPVLGQFERFVRFSISNKIVEFKGHGKHGEWLHDVFDEILVGIEVFEGSEPLDIRTT